MNASTGSKATPRALAKLILVGLVHATYFFIAGVVYLVFFWNPVLRRHWLARNLSFSSRCMLRVLGIQVTFSGEIPDRSRNFLIVSNHTTYTDVLVLASVLPCIFVTSREVEQTFGLGHTCRAGGCLFVERRKRTSVGQDLDQIVTLLHQGFHVVVFPEGTTSDGNSVLPFKASFLACAERAGVAVLPACIDYRTVDGVTPPTREQRDAVHYYGDMDFLPHLMRLVSLRRIEVTARFLPLIESTSDRKKVTETAYQGILKAYLDREPGARI